VDADQARFPPRYDVITVLEILMQIIKTPGAEAAELAKALRVRGVKITAVKVQRVLDFYGMKKKRNTRRRQSSPSTDA
jgi:NADH:ubiquinone oxidoreductase subunit E